MKQRICVVGAGIVGLSCALKLKKVLGSNYRITVIADKFGRETTSDIAGGSFRPAHVPSVSGYKGKRSAVGKDILRLSHERYQLLLRSAESENAGIHRLIGYDIKYPGVGKPDEEPFYVELFHNCHTLSKSELLAKFPLLPRESTGNLIETVIVSSRTCMAWLTHRIEELGGKFVRRFVDSFDELWDDYDIVVNCTGLGAKHLTGDGALEPSRGQAIRMRIDNPVVKNTFVYIDNGKDKMPYYIWTPDDTIIGGTKLVGVHDTTISPADHDMIMTECKEMYPWLDITEDKIVKEVVGLRPGRPSIHLETERIRYKGNEKWLVHNFGHGAHGVSLSWGSACIAVEMVTEVLQRSKL